MKSQMIVKSNIFDKINNYVSIDKVKQVFKWWDSKIFCSIDIKLWTVKQVSIAYQINCALPCLNKLNLKKSVFVAGLKTHKGQSVLFQWSWCRFSLLIIDNGSMIYSFYLFIQQTEQWGYTHKW